MPFCTCSTRCKGGKEVSERTWRNHAPLRESQASQPAIQFSQNLSNFLDSLSSTHPQQQSTGNRIERSRSPPPGPSRNQRQRVATTVSTPEDDSAPLPDPGPFAGEDTSGDLDGRQSPEFYSAVRPCFI
jgi:hypothetical protein